MELDTEAKQQNMIDRMNVIFKKDYCNLYSAIVRFNTPIVRSNVRQKDGKTTFLIIGDSIDDDVERCRYCVGKIRAYRGKGKVYVIGTNSEIML